MGIGGGGGGGWKKGMGGGRGLSSQFVFFLFCFSPIVSLPVSERFCRRSGDVSQTDV